MKLKEILGERMLEKEYCHRCGGNGRLWADGKAHRPSYNGETVLCGECGGSGSRYPDFDDLSNLEITEEDLNRVGYVKEVQERLKICPICKGKKEWYCKTASCMYPCQDCNETGYVKIKELIK